MIQFICATTACVSNYLGFGIVMAQTQSQIVYQHYGTSYYCERQSTIYRCSTVAEKVNNKASW